MEYIISKELLSEVLGFSIDNCWNDGNLIVWKEDGMSEINVFELAHKCKEWAKSKDFDIYSGYDSDIVDGMYFCTIDRYDISIIRFAEYSYSEVEAIFKACQWLLENKAE